MTRLLASASVVIGLLASANAALAAQQTVTLAVKNMVCEACPYIVKKTLQQVPGVAKATVSFKDGMAVVIFDDAKTNVKALTDATKSAGFPSSPKS
jgi:periplasmic mercuric ion binding protein